MSKSTISNEITKRKDYNSLTLTEYLEFIARVSEVYYRNIKTQPKEEQKEDSSSNQDPSLTIDQTKLEFSKGETRNVNSLEQTSTFRLAPISLSKSIDLVSTS